MTISNKLKEMKYIGGMAGVGLGTTAIVLTCILSPGAFMVFSYIGIAACALMASFTLVGNNLPVPQSHMDDGAGGSGDSPIMLIGLCGMALLTFSIFFPMVGVVIFGALAAVASGFIFAGIGYLIDEFIVPCKNNNDNGVPDNAGYESEKSDSNIYKVHDNTPYQAANDSKGFFNARTTNTVRDKDQQDQQDQQDQHTIQKSLRFQ